MRLGFACNWAPDEERAWSGTPFQLRSALREQIDVCDLGLCVPPLPRLALRAAFARRHDGHLVSAWDHSALWARACRTLLPRRATAQGCNVVLEVGDLTSFDQPFFCYQDLSVDVILRHHDESGAGTPHFPGLSKAFLQRRRDRQRAVYDRAAGVIAMSHFLARDLVEVSGLPPDKVSVVHPGATSLIGQPPPAARRDRARHRLLFVGRDFQTKGGDSVLAAFAQLRRDHDPAMVLTVAGPAGWPVDGLVPDGVRFLGAVPAAEVTRLYDEHDLLVMPSRLEGFGIVFVEALARGLPCLARDAFAMPEIVRDGDNGALVAGDDPAELANTIVCTLADDGIYERCLAQRDDVARHYTWERAAGEVVRAVRGAATA